ncbi:group 1 truncated hemoglobin [Colwellia sp. Arc7-635]|uniref:group I truncated hemoglobin n=1 Tax=Colwellia sp. Arc7-635 TaxID=2497879 RepID=UPI000F84F3FA|nr:group 1 truncated hemoglobin [Colwellia sp. Arc7-635]AZQ84524.1 group 1 truncated hemoglobin [Colwellia sp. Arc7-635]
MKSFTKAHTKNITNTVWLVLIAFCFSCSSNNNGLNDADINVAKITSDLKPNASKLSLYNKMGRQGAIDKIVDNLINIIGQDDVIFAHFAHSNVSHFRKNLSIFLCAITDGPCQYIGDNMQDIHRGMYINKNQFNHFVELFIEAMKVADISYPLQNQLLARLAPLRRKIIKI